MGDESEWQQVRVGCEGGVEIHRQVSDAQQGEWGVMSKW